MSQNDRDYSEKRDFIRMRLEATVTLFHKSQEIPALCTDLSSTGLQVEATCLLHQGDQLRVYIPSEHPELRGLEADVEVVRVRPLTGGRQAIGLTIINMD